MNLPRFALIGALIVLCAMLTGCGDKSVTRENSAASGKAGSSSTCSYETNIVTGDIKAGIEKHIAQEVRRGNGYFIVPFEEKGLHLKLVRVHVEYLATLAPGRHFACVDMVGTDGEFYDVDFFMSGDPGAMTVTETMVHKINGKPLYVWKQAPDKSWGRAPVDKASNELLGILPGRDVFEFRYHATLPAIDGDARMWLPVAGSDDFQKVEVREMSVPGKSRMLKDSVYGNKVLYAELGPEDSGKAIDILYMVERREKSAYAGDRTEAARYLAPERLVPADGKIKAIAMAAVEGKQGDLMRARALYDTVMDEMRYKKYGEGWGKGDAVYACNTRYGNCTDFHSYFVALARAAGIPARFAIGAAIPSDRDDGGTDGYHCWAEFYADGKWWPVDISEANKFSALSMYYFGHHPANRFEFSRGRDLVVEPGPVSGPINFLAYPVLEIKGKPAKTEILFTFKRNR